MFEELDFLKLSLAMQGLRYYYIHLGQAVIQLEQHIATATTYKCRIPRIPFDFLAKPLVRMLY